MAVSLSDLLAQKQTLEHQIRAARSTAKADAIAQVRKLMTDFDLTSADLAGPAKGKSDRQLRKVAAKYRDPSTGSTWSGRGLKPKWMTAAIHAGKSPDEFLI